MRSAVKGYQDPRDAVVALGLAPGWLRFAPCPSSGGRQPGTIPDLQRWLEEFEQGDLRDLCTLTPDGPSLTVEPRPKERVLLLTLTSGDEQRDQRDLAELEGLVRSAGAEPVARTSQRRGQANPQTLWGSELQEAALEIRRCRPLW